MKALRKGLAAQQAGQPNEAIAHYRTALRQHPGLAPAHFNLGQLLREQGCYAEAAACFEGAARLRPGAVDAWLNLGVMCEKLDRHRDALAAYERATAANPADPAPQYNRGNALLGLGDFAGAAIAFRAVIELDPGHLDAQWNLATALLSMGQFEAGWRQYEWRWKKLRVDPADRFPWPLWRGEAVAGKSILVWREQGLGDELLFVTCVRELVSAGADVTLAASPRLVSLLARAFPSVAVIPDGSWGAAPFDCHVPIGGLARYLRQRADQFPPSAKFLVPESTHATRWSTRLDQLEPGPRIGICWRSGLMTEERNRQYTELCDWGPLLSIPGVHWINLQYDECTAEVARAEKAFGATIHQWRKEDLKNDLESVVGLLWNLDYVITAPTAVSSLAGGVGVATLELDAGGDWTTHGEERSPWFPSIRVIRRPSGTLGWGSVIERVADDVRRSVGEMVPR